MRFGVNVLNYGSGAVPAALIAWGRLAEETGFDFLAISDHVAITDDVYREYVRAEDEKEAQRMGRRMAASIRLVRGREYNVKQSVGLYPTAGAADDYAFSRHLVNRKQGKIIAFTIEWGRSHASTPFHPPYPEMRKVMRDVTAGLLAMCVRAR